MQPPNQNRPRNTAWFALATLLVMLVTAVLFESGQAPISYALRAYGPFALVAALPLLYIAVALTRGPSTRALALGVAYPVAVLVLFWRTVSATAASGSEGAMEVGFMFLFFWFSKPWTLFLLVFVPTMIRLLVVSWRAYRSDGSNRLGLVAGWAAAMMIGVIVAGIPAALVADETPEYRPDVVDNAIAPLNECIWRAAGPGAEAGFPDSLSAIRNVQYRAYPHTAGRHPNVCAEQFDAISRRPFDVDYRTTNRDATGRARGFTLRLVEKTRAGGRPRHVWYDESGLRRNAVAVSDGVMDSIRLESARALSTFLIAQHLIDEYAAARGGEYPLSIVSRHRFRDGRPAPAGALAADVGDCWGFEDRVASCIEMWERSLVYAPYVDGAERVRAYTLTMHTGTYYDDERQQPIPSRTHHRDRSGALHSFGGWRPANDTDPPPPPDEVAMARDGLRLYLENRARDSVTAAYRKRQRDSIDASTR